MWGAVAVLLLLGLVAGGGWLGYRWTQTQYYLAPDGDAVAIYQGIPQQVGPIELSELHTTTDLQLDELAPYVQDRIRATITVSSYEEAHRRVTELREDTT